MKSHQQEDPFNITRENQELSLSKITRSPNENTVPLLPRSEEQRVLRDSWLKWMALSLTCMINFALNYSSNNPQALQPSIEEFFQIGDAKFNLLYSVYSMPNIILPFVGGFLTDFLGVRFAVNVFGFIVIIGQGVFTYGTYQEDFDMMVIGRFIFGLGGESLTVSQLPFLAKWFSGTKLAFAWGFAKAAVRLGKAANSFFTPKFYIWSSILYVPLLVGLGISTAAWIGGLFLSYLDEKADQQEHRSSSAEGDKKKSLISCRDLKNLPFIFYLFLLSYACLFGSFIGVSNNLNNILVTRFGFDMNDAGNLVMAYYLVSAIAGPFVGLLIENYGRRTILMLVMTFVLLATNVMFAFLNDGSEADPNYAVAFPLIGISIFSSFYTILVWPCIPLVVEKRVIGTATGLITCMSNLMLTLLPMMVGVIHDKTIDFHFGYFWTEIAFSGVVFVGLLLDYWIHIEDARKGSKLDKAKKNHPMVAVAEQDRDPEIYAEIIKSEEEAEARL